MKYKLGVFASTSEEEMSHINEQLSAMLRVIRSKFPSHSINNASFSVERWTPETLETFDAATTFRTEEGARAYGGTHLMTLREALACRWTSLDAPKVVPAFVPFGCTQRIALADVIVNELFRLDPTARLETAYDYINCRSLMHLRKVGRRFKDL